MELLCHGLTLERVGNEFQFHEITPHLRTLSYLHNEQSEIFTKLTNVMHKFILKLRLVFCFLFVFNAVILLTFFGLIICYYSIPYSWSVLHWLYLYQLCTYQYTYTFTTAIANEEAPVWCHVLVKI